MTLTTLTLATLLATLLPLAAAAQTEPEPEAMPEPTLEERCEKEVVELHAFFEGWFNGSIPDTDESYSRFTGVLADGFAIIGPSGNLTERQELVEGLRSSRSPEGSEPIRIWIEDFRFHRLGGDMALVTYEEWQQRGNQRRGRLSSALLRQRAGTPNGLEWLHVHETWLPR